MISKRYKIGYTQGTFDLFHIGHLNLLKRAKGLCDYLIVGVNSDELVKKYKNKETNICDDQRLEIVKALKVVDEAVISSTLDKLDAYKKFKFDAIFIGDDWQGDERWKKTEEDLKTVGAVVKYLPHTEGISTTILLNDIKNKRR